MGKLSKLTRGSSSCFSRRVVLITGVIEVFLFVYGRNRGYEHTHVPEVLITNPKKIQSIWKDEEAVVASTRCFFSQKQWIFWRVSWLVERARTSFRFGFERQWLYSSKRKDPNITALKSESWICTSLFPPPLHEVEVVCSFRQRFKHFIFLIHTKYKTCTVKTHTIFSHHRKGRVSPGFLRISKTALDCYSFFIL